eukprot:CAMPEP_0197477714 /NCGR_PEP_ID=MMETSP1309-20131121/20012_1 /TAXON_ID=464262 /ORGANISM="Genus nov. species nov., Strain RCC998" /LENGTH=348 /DNA_ID=CAMNT_0043018815 /DNA_START=18 /DNA_END=1060 /DNA_ORIENTATION=-
MRAAQHFRRVLACKSYRNAAKSDHFSHIEKILPLCTTEKRVSVSLRDVLTSYKELKAATDSEISRLSGKDAPGKESLYTELLWLVEDTLASSVEDWRAILRQGESEFLNSGSSQEVESRLSVDELQDLWSYRIKERVPIQYILGTASWYDLELRVGSGVLIPRPETEVLLDYALKALKENESLCDEPWLDLGTGSGALAIGIALHADQDFNLPLKVQAVDASEKALKYAEENVERYHLRDRVQLFQGSWFEPIEESQKFAGIVSNPPYIPGPEMHDLQAEVRLHEPSKALTGGVDGMEDLVLIATQAPKFLVPCGFLGLETGSAKQAYELKELLSKLSFSEVQVLSDL